MIGSQRFTEGERSMQQETDWLAMPEACQIIFTVECCLASFAY